MIARLRGKLRNLAASSAWFDVGGVGYHVLVPISILERLDSDEVDLHIHTEVREDAILLFGFLSKREREVFRRLLSVQGIGPMTALAVLSGLSLEDILTAVRSRDHKTLQGIPKIGKRTAERICLELGERFEDMAVPEPASPGGDLRDALTALEHLGYKTAAASAALNRAKKEAPDGPLETWIRLALMELSPSGR